VKVAVRSTGATLDSPIDPRFGRAKMFVVVDMETNEFEAIDNTQNLNALQGAGIQSGETIARTGARQVITGHCGPKAFQTLRAAGIEVVTGASGTVAQAVEQFRDGKLGAVNKPDVESHWA